MFADIENFISTTKPYFLVGIGTCIVLFVITWITFTLVYINYNPESSLLHSNDKDNYLFGIGMGGTCAAALAIAAWPLHWALVACLIVAFTIQGIIKLYKFGIPRVKTGVVSLFPKPVNRLDPEQVYKEIEEECDKAEKEAAGVKISR